jgi:hypothetical protein
MNENSRIEELTMKQDRIIAQTEDAAADGSSHVAGLPWSGAARP